MSLDFNVGWLVNDTREVFEDQKTSERHGEKSPQIFPDRITGKIDHGVWKQKDIYLTEDY
jgi:hypothetical protein